MDQVVDELGNRIGKPHTKILFISKIHSAIGVTNDYPLARNRTGIAATNDGELTINVKLLTAFLGIKTNSLNKNLREHGLSETKR
jgi:hypothetical protein